MPTVRRASGIHLTVPATLQVVEYAPRRRAPRRAGPGRTFGPVPLPAAPAGLPPDAVVAAFAQQDMTLLDQVEVVPATPLSLAAPRRARPRATPATLAVDVPLGAHEDAAVLLEQEGFYSWHFGSEAAPVAPAKRSKTRGAGLAPARAARFSIALGGELAAGAAGRRGVVRDAVLGKIRAFIFKFAARVVVGQAMKFLERKVRRGLVSMPGNDPAAWRLLADSPPLVLPTRRPARILLFVHGTFSSTVGAYAALAGTPWGQEFLAATHATYDAVLGFDHATLSDDPLENAAELLAALQGLAWVQPPRFDVVAHSRGGLVVRSLLEQLLPLTRFPGQFERVVFVGATNGGTLLAAPANWQALVDLYTNLAVATCRLLGLMPQAKALAATLEETVRGLGPFVKYCATTAVGERVVPGLAAMEPTGDFVRRLNEEQPGQPSIAQSYYCAVTTEFRPQVLGGTHQPQELPARLVQWLGSSFMQSLMREANDLVVNTAAMTQLDPQLGNYLKDRLDFGPNPQVYHTNYFVRPEVVNALTRWLRLVGPPAGAGPRPASRALAAPRRKPPEAAGTGGPGAFAGEELPAGVDTDVYVTTADAPVGDALRAVRAAHPSYVVVRHFGQGKAHDYVFPAEEVLALAGQPTEKNLFTTLGLAARTPAEVRSVGAVRQATKAVGAAVPALAALAVVLANGQPAGVLPPPATLPDAAALAALARQILNPQQDEEFVVRRRTMPTFVVREAFSAATANSLAADNWHRTVLASSGHDELPPTKTRPRPAAPAARKAAPAPAKAASAKAAPAPCYFRAEMEEEVVLGRPTSVEVLISREQLGGGRHPAAANASAAVEPDRQLQVQVLPKVNFESADAGWQDVAPPAPGAPQALYFTLRATHAGEGEVWVLVRQAQRPLVTLVLKPLIVRARQPGAAGRILVDTEAAEAPPITAAVHQLIILERRNGPELSYRYQLQLPGLGVLQWSDSKPLVGDRQQYVAGLYQEIENRWVSNAQDVENFTAELRALGGTLFDELIPPELQRLLWQYRAKINSILVIAEEPFIPWELVHLHAPGKPLGTKPCFLGQLGLVRWLHEAGWPRQTLRLRPGKRHYVIPHYPHPDYELLEAEKEEDFLRQTLGATAIVPTAKTVRTLLGRPGAFDLLHFACHGEANHANIANAQLLLEGRLENGSYLPEYFSASTAEQYANFAGHAPIVVLNACQAGRLGYRLTGVGGFAQAFLRRGAGAFIGTLWAVGDRPARHFTEALYQQLLGGTTLAEAASAAREAARRAGDATWLAYAVYGHPYARLELEIKNEE